MAKVKFKGKPDLEEKIVIKKELNNQSFAGFGSLGEMIETKTNMSILSAENIRLQKELDEIKKNHFEVLKENKNYELECRSLNDKVKEQDWNYKTSLQSIERQNDKFDKILEIGGRIAIEKAEQSGIDISGFLSGLASPAPQEKLSPQKTDADVEFSPTESKEKEQARIIATQIYDNLNIIINNSRDDSILDIMNKIVNIYNYSTKDTENLNEIHELIKTE